MGEAAQRRKAGLGPRPAEETAQLAAPGRDERMGFILRPIVISGRTFIIDRTGKRVKVQERVPYRSGGNRLVCVEDAATLKIITDHIESETKAEMQRGIAKAREQLGTVRPARVSVRPDDVGHTAFLAYPGVLAELDGVTLRDCVMADEELGLAVVQERGEDGLLIATNGVAQEKQLTGAVRIKWPDDSPWAQAAAPIYGVSTPLPSQPEASESIDV